MTSAERKLLNELKAEVIQLRDSLEVSKELAEIKAILVEIKEELDQSPKLVALTDRVRTVSSKLNAVVTENSIERD